MRSFTLAACAAVLTLCPALAQAVEVQGDYVEARNADVFTGPCFSNAEILIVGKQAVLAVPAREPGNVGGRRRRGPLRRRGRPGRHHVHR